MLKVASDLAVRNRCLPLGVILRSAVKSCSNKKVEGPWGDYIHATLGVVEAGHLCGKDKVVKDWHATCACFY